MDTTTSRSLRFQKGHVPVLSTYGTAYVLVLRGGSGGIHAKANTIEACPEGRCGRPPTLGAPETRRIDEDRSEPSWHLEISEIPFRELVCTKYLKQMAGTKYPIPGSWYHVLCTKYLVPKHLVPSILYQSFGAKYFVPGPSYQSTWYRVPGTKFLVPKLGHKTLVPSTCTIKGPQTELRSLQHKAIRVPWSAGSHDITRPALTNARLSW